jgi:hypothetical protein
MPPASSRKLAELLNHMVREMGADTVPASMFFEDERPRTPRATRQSRGRSDGRGRDGRE